MLNNTVKQLLLLVILCLTNSLSQAQQYSGIARRTIAGISQVFVVDGNYFNRAVFNQTTATNTPLNATGQLSGISFDINGRGYLTERQTDMTPDNRIWTLAPNATTWTVLLTGSPTTFISPIDVLADPINNRTYILERNAANVNNTPATRLRVWNGASYTTLQTFQNPHSLAFNTDGNIWVSDLQGNTINLINAVSGALMRQCAITSPAGIMVGVSGRVYVSTNTNIQVLAPNDCCVIGSIPVNGARSIRFLINQAENALTITRGDNTLDILSIPTFSTTSVSLDCNNIAVSNTNVFIPLNIIGFTPSVSNPLNITVVRNPSGQSISTTITGLPYTIVDTNPTNANTSYQYTIQAATVANVCNLIAQGSCSITTPPSTPTNCNGDLWGMDTPTDTGDDVATCAMNGIKAWQSPDIWLSPSSNAFFDDTDQAPVVGGVNYVYVRVRNRGTAPDAGVLKLYWAAASTGLTWPNSWTGAEFCGTLPLGGEITSTPISNMGGVGSYISHGVGDTRVFRFEWTFPNTAAYANCLFGGSQVDNHHFCLLARIEQPADACRNALPGFETINTYKNTICNNNIFWQNITVLEGDGRGGEMKAGVIVKGVCLPTIYIRTGDAPTDSQPLCVATTKFVWTSTKTNSFFYSAGLQVDLGQQLYDMWIAQGQQGEGITLVGGTTINITKSGAYIILDMGQIATGLIHNFIAYSTICRNYEVDLTQYSCNSINGCRIIGGETFSLRNFCNGIVVPPPPYDERNINKVARKGTDNITNEMTIYPNPSSTSNITISFEDVLANENLSDKSETIINVSDLLGNIMRSYKATQNNNIELNLAGLAKGIYIVTAQSNGKIYTKRLVLQ